MSAIGRVLELRSNLPAGRPGQAKRQPGSITTDVCNREKISTALPQGGAAAYGSRIAFAEPVIGRAFARPVGSLVRDDGGYDLKKLFAASLEARFLVMATCNRSISEVISAIRSESSSTDSN